MQVLKLLITSALCIIFAAGLVMLDKKTSFGKLNYALKQIFIGVLFGGVSVLASDYSVDLNGALMNVRDAVSLSAGLIFGGTAGIVAGVIGGVYRWFNFIWDVGEYTRVAASVTTLLSGFLAAAIRKIMFDDKPPYWLYGFSIGAVYEVFHMLMIFFTNIDDTVYAFGFIQKCALTMILANGITLMVTILVAAKLNKEDIYLKRYQRPIAETFQAWLLVCVVIAFAATGILTYKLQTRMSYDEVESLLKVNIEDVCNDIKDNGDAASVAKNRHIGKNGFVIICDEDMKITGGMYGVGSELDETGFSMPDPKMPQESLFEAKFNSTPVYCSYKILDGCYVIGVIPKDDAMIMRDVSVYLGMFMESLVFAVLFLLVFFLVKKIVIENINRVNSDLAQITGGNLDVSVNVRTSEEFTSLSDDINETVNALKGYIAQAAARIDRELEFAKTIQYSSMPSVFPPYPNRDDFDIYAAMYTAKEVGGDFYDFNMVGDNSLAFLVADVSGKGIPAAMFMMKAKAIIKDLAESGIEVNEILTRTNEELCKNNKAGMFVTAWIGIIDLSTGIVSVANAGHNPPLVRHADGEFEYFKVHPGMVLAGMEGLNYRRFELKLMPGDKIYLYTDGVTEAADKDRHLYGEDRLQKVLNCVDNADARQICELVKKDIDLFADGAPQYDDITMLCLGINYMEGERCITVVPDINSVKAVKRFGNNITVRLNLPSGIANKINIIVDEIYSNIVHYSGAKYAKLSYEVWDGSLTLIFSDDGKPYNPLEQDSPDITLSAEERQIGGLGIFMVKNFAESMEYNRCEDKNVLSLKILLK